jgi:hypothetical protein
LVKAKGKRKEHQGRSNPQAGGSGKENEGLPKQTTQALVPVP